jgi:glycosyltransferase involved in cell wall biosynthesis
MQFEPPIFALGKLLGSLQHEVVCLGYHTAGLPSTEVVSPNYTIHRFPRREFCSLPRLIRGGLRLLQFWRDIYQFGRQFKPHCVISYSYETLPAALRIPRAGDLVYYCAEYSPGPCSRDYAIGWGFLKLLEPTCVRHCDHVISVEPDRAKLQEAQWRRRVDHVILNAPDFDPDIETRALAAVRSRSGHARFVMAGTISKRACVEPLIESALLCESVSLDLYGRLEPSYADHFNQLIQSLPTIAGRRIRYHGPVPYHQLGTALLEYDVGICAYDDCSPNTALASPAKLFEYMRSGLAVVATAQPTPSRVVTTSCCGFVVPPTTLDGLPAIMRRLDRNHSELITLRANALRAFREKFAFSAQAGPLVSEIVKGPRTQPCRILSSEADLRA